MKQPAYAPRHDPRALRSMRTVAIYQKIPGEGLTRLGVFKPWKGYSIRAISDQFMRRHPALDPATLYIAPRLYFFGRYSDSIELFPFDVTKGSE